MAGPKYKRVQKEDPDSNQMYEHSMHHGGNSGTRRSSGGSKETEKVQIITTAAEYRSSDATDSGFAKKDLICYTSCITTAVITSYFVLSITLTFYNQWIFKVTLIFISLFALTKTFGTISEIQVSLIRDLISSCHQIHPSSNRATVISAIYW